MCKPPNNPVTAALTFKVPQKVGWSVQHRDKSWTGNDLVALASCLLQEASNHAITMSVSVIFELPGNDGRQHREPLRYSGVLTDSTN